MDQKIIDLFDEYTHAPLDRHEFLKRLITLTGTFAAAMAILPMLEVNQAKAAVIEENDKDLETSDITYASDHMEVKAYQASPKGKNKLGSVIIIHENRGLNAHIKDVARRAAKAGYIALAPDALSGTGGTPANEDEARKLIGELDPVRNLNNFLKALTYLSGHKKSNKKIGTIGFCWGGAMANQLAVNSSDLKIAIPFYGRQPAIDEVKKIKARIQLHYAGTDDRVNAGISQYEDALKASGIKYELFIYEGTQHAFHNDTSIARYNEAAANLAWQRTLQALRETIG